MGIEGIENLIGSSTGRATKNELKDWMTLNALSPGDRREREIGYWFKDARAYVFVPDPSSSTAADAATKFRKFTNGRTMGFYTAGSDWPSDPLKSNDMLCFYNDKGPLTLRGDNIENVVHETIRKYKLMMVFEFKDCYEIMEAR